MVLPRSLSMCFFSPFSNLITCLGKKELVFLFIVYLFVSNAHVNLCHFFSSSWCQVLAATSACGSFWTFLFTFPYAKNDGMFRIYDEKATIRHKMGKEYVQFWRRKLRTASAESQQDSCFPADDHQAILKQCTQKS